MTKRADVPDIARDDTRQRRASGARRKAATLEPRARTDPRRLLVVVGNGMVSQRFCERAVELGLPRTHGIVVFGEEALPAYNRVELTRVLGGHDATSLIIKPVRWYAESGIDLRLGERVVVIDRARRLLTTQLGDEQAYDALVLATGSYASTPVIPGADQHGVFSYRTALDAQRIRTRARALAAEGVRVVVIGSGLLGLETGQALAELGCGVTFVEAAPQLLPRQLDPTSAGIVALLLRSAGFELCVGQAVERIVLTSQMRRPHLPRAADGSDVEVPDTRLRVVLAGRAGAIDCGMVVLAAGVRPRDELARASGIACPNPGGIAVDDALSTGDPHVFAIGECARHAGRCPGLVAPGLAMAEVLAERFAGSDVRFTGHQPPTRLEVVRRSIVVMGENRAAGDEEVKTVEADDRYRRLVLRDGRLIGATAIGDGDDLSHLQEALVLRTKVRRGDLRRLERGVDPWRGLRFPAGTGFPDTATVCGCTGVTFGALRRARAEGHCSVEQLCARTGAGSGCGSCRGRIAAFSNPSGRDAGTSYDRRLAVLSLLALALVPLGAAVAPLGSRTIRVMSPHPLDALMTDHFVRELSGFGLGLLCLLTAVSIALPKRRSARRTTGSPRARTWHALLGLLCLAGVAAHTGLHPGRGLDLALSVCLLALIGVGAASALSIASGVGSGPGADAVKRSGLRLHVWIAWPAPVLLVGHVLKSYYF
jgi:nitrite reductase (NADH) large subunit